MVALSNRELNLPRDVVLKEGSVTPAVHATFLSPCLHSPPVSPTLGAADGPMAKAPVNTTVRIGFGEFRFLWGLERVAKSIKIYICVNY